MIVPGELPLRPLIEGFDDFYRRERPRLLRLAHLLTGSPGIGEELVQETLLAVHARWHEIDNPGGYARRALVNMSRSHHRRLSVERRHTRGEQLAYALPPEIDETWAAIRRLPRSERSSSSGSTRTCRSTRSPACSTARSAR